MVSLPYINQSNKYINSYERYGMVKIPPESVWLIHDFMNLSKKDMKIIYKELRKPSTTTLCDDDIHELILCYQVKKEEEEEEIKEKIKEKNKNIKIPFMKKPRKN